MAKTYVSWWVVFIAFVSLFGAVFGRLVADYKETQDDYMKIRQILQKPRELERYLGGTPSKDRLLGFSYSDCGSSSAPMHLHSLRLQPDPLKIPGNITVSFNGSVSQPIKAPLELDLEVKKKVVFWITVPCIDDVGSCDYEDVCELIQKVSCPPEFAKYGIPCQCPFRAGDYFLPDVTTDVIIHGVPEWLTEGDYEIEAKLKYQGTEVGCLKLQLSITD